MSYNDLVSIITPAYNSEEYISYTIECVIAQMYKNWEMIIVNDMSSDKTVNIINEYLKKDKRIRLIDLDINSGAAAARNIALENAKGRFIAFLDSDDAWKKDKLERQLAFMKENNYCFTFTAYEYMKNPLENSKIFRVPASINYNQGLKNTVIGCLTVIIDKKMVGDFRMPLIRRGQDNLTWLMLLKQGHIAYGLNEVLAEYRLRDDNSLSNNKISALKRQWWNYRNVIKLPLFKCVYYYLWYIFNNVKKYYLNG